MGLYRRKSNDPVSGEKIPRGPWWMKYYRDGRPFYESTGTTDKREAQRRLNERLGQIATGTYVGHHIERTLFEDLVEGIVQDYTLNRRKSIRRLHDYLKHLGKRFHRRRASSITTDQIQQYVISRQGEGAQNGTINRELGCLKRMFKLALQHTPPKVTRIPHIPKLEEHNVRSGFASYEEFLAVRGALPDHGKVAVSLAYWLGLRIGEVLSLQWDQVDVWSAKLFLRPLQTKTETPRVAYLPPDLVELLKDVKQRTEAEYPGCVWVCQRRGERVLSIKRAWKTACRRIGSEGLLVHDLRRTAVRNMVRAGIPEKVAMAISGHKTRSVFDRYNIVNEADLELAAGRLQAYINQEKVTLAVTLAELSRGCAEGETKEVVETVGESLVPPIRIERTTRGLGKLPDHLAPAYSTVL
ncbi:MAG: site-specific integrase [Nitrospira sp. WS110]|nr:site-specific integrase [Nitrospira sp. WS110]